MILQEIRSIIDPQEFHQLVDFLERVKKESGMSQFLLDCYELRLQFETADEKETERLKENFIKNVDAKFRLLTPKIVDYKTSKTDVNVNTIRHGFDLLKQVHKLDYIRKNGYVVTTSSLPQVPYLDIIDQKILGGDHN